MRKIIDFTVGKSLAQICLKDAVNATSWSDLHGDIDSEITGREILQSLTDLSVFDRLRPLMSQAQLNMPIFAGSPIYGSTVAEAGPIPASKHAIVSAIEAPIKAAALVAVTKEGLASREGLANLSAEMKRAVALATDEAFFAAIAADADQDETASNNLLADLAKLLGHVVVTGAEVPHLILPPATVNGLCFEDHKQVTMSPQGGTIGGIPTYPGTLPEGVEALLFDPAAVFAGADELKFFNSESATIDVGDDILMSVFQLDLTAVKAIRSFTAKLMRPTRAAVLLTNAG